MFNTKLFDTYDVLAEFDIITADEHVFLLHHDNDNPTLHRAALNSYCSNPAERITAEPLTNTQARDHNAAQRCMCIANPAAGTDDYWAAHELVGLRTILNDSQTPRARTDSVLVGYLRSDALQAARTRVNHPALGEALRNTIRKVVRRADTIAADAYEQKAHREQFNLAFKLTQRDDFVYRADLRERVAHVESRYADELFSQASPADLTRDSYSWVYQGVGGFGNGLLRYAVDFDPFNASYFSRGRQHAAIKVPTVMAAVAEAYGTWVLAVNGDLDVEVVTEAAGLAGAPTAQLDDLILALQSATIT